MAIWTSEIKELERLYESVKGQSPDLEKELEQLIRTEDANVIMLYSRRCLEVIITDLCECELKRPRKTEPLKGIIDKLHKEEKVPSHIITSMYGLNELSTYGAHPKDFDPEQVKPVLNNLDIIIKWYLRYKNIVAIGKIEGEEEKIVSRDELLNEVKNDGIKEVQEKPDRAHNKKVLLNSIVIVVLLAIAATLLFPKIFKKDTLKNLRSSGERISVAVMPFQNMTNDTTKEVLQDWIQDILITALSNSKEIKVMPTESINNLLKSRGITNYASITPSIANSVSQKMGANFVVYGNIKQAGFTIRLNAQLIDTKTEEVIKSFQIQGPSGKDLIFNIIDSLSIQVNDFLVISKLKKENLKIQELVFTKSPDAYRYFIYGQSAFAKRDFPSAINMLSQAIAIDSNYTYAALHIAWAYMNQGLYEEGKKWCLKVYAKRDKMSFQQRIYTDFVHARFYETPNEAIKYLQQLLEIEDQLPHAYYDLGNSYSILYQYDKAITAFEKSLQLYNEWDSKPWWVQNYTGLGNAYHKTGQYKKEIKLYNKAEKDFPDNPSLYYRKAILSLIEKDTIVSNDYFEKYKSLLEENSASESEIETNLANIYSEAGILDKAEKYYRQALSLEPENPIRINNLAYFLIDKDRNVKVGLEITDKALGLSPDDYTCLHSKGWGLYKQGKYIEALDMLQKSWDLRREKAIYNHEAFLHLEAAKKAVAVQKNN
jgi:tetratricopeptide (TPR) repeat protein